MDFTTNAKTAAHHIDRLLPAVLTFVETRNEMNKLDGHLLKGEEFVEEKSGSKKIPAGSKSKTRKVLGIPNKKSASRGKVR